MSTVLTALAATWSFIANNGQALQTLAVIAGLIAVLIQTGQIRKQLRLGNITATGLHFPELNRFLLHDKWSLNLLETEEVTILAALLIGNLETRYQMREAGLLNNQLWKSDIQTMVDTFSHPFMPREWRRLENEYYPPFAKFINEKVLPEAEAVLRARPQAAESTTNPSPAS